MEHLRRPVAQPVCSAREAMAKAGAGEIRYPRFDSKPCEFDRTMFLEIPDLVTGVELATLRRIGGEAPFVVAVQVPAQRELRQEPGLRVPAYATRAAALGRVLRGIHRRPPPPTYEGGELTIHLGSRPIAIKGAAGSVVVDPSTTIHEVHPVRAGERIVTITLIQSQILDEK